MTALGPSAPSPLSKHPYWSCALASRGALLPVRVIPALVEPAGGGVVPGGPDVDALIAQRARDVDDLKDQGKPYPRAVRDWTHEHHRDMQQRWIGFAAPSSNRPGSASAMPTMSGRSATNGRASEAESFARMRAVRSGPCGAPRAILASRHTLTAASSSWGRMLRTFTGGSYARLRAVVWRTVAWRISNLVRSVNWPGWLAA